MRAASRALAVLLAVAAMGSPAAAEEATAACPTAVGDLPLSVAVPFSGTPRPVADENGEITSISLLCAYGEGVEPSAEITVQWDPQAEAACGDTTTVVATGIDRAPFDAAAADLATEVGGPCPEQEEASFPIKPAAAGAAALLLIAATAITVRRRAAHKRGSPQRRETPVVSEGGPVRAEETAGGRPPSSDETTLVGPPAHRPADFSQVLQQLQTDDTLARSTTGQLVALAAVAHSKGNDAARELALAEALRSGRHPARHDLAELAERLAHQPQEVGR